MIRFIVVPDMLQQAPMFKRVGPNAMKGRGIGSARGRATIMRGTSLGPLYLSRSISFCSTKSSWPWCPDGTGGRSPLIYVVQYKMLIVIHLIFK